MAMRNTTNLLIIAFLTVLVLVMIFLFVLQNQALEQTRTQVADLRKKLQAAEDQRKAAIQETQSLRNLIRGSIDPVAVSDISTDLQEARQFLLRARSESPPEKGAPPNFQDLLRDYQQALTVMEQKLKGALKELAKANLAARQREESHKAAIQAKNQEVAKLQDEVSKLRGQVEDLSSRLADREARYTQQIMNKDDEITSLTFKYERTIRMLSEQLAQAKDEVKRLRMRIVPEKGLASARPQGSIVKVANRHTAFIDLGRRDFVRPGLVFEVYQQIGKTRKKKGMIEINRVEETWSQVTILNETSELDPIVPGDYIWSPFYMKGRAPTVVLVGDKPKTSLLSKEFLVSRLTQRGAKVADAVNVDTDYVIAIEGYQNDPKYNEARLQGVMVLREEEILPYVLP